MELDFNSDQSHFVGLRNFTDLLDNANLTQRLLHIVLPLSKPGLVVTSIFTLILCWNEFPFALLFLERPHMFALPL